MNNKPLAYLVFIIIVLGGGLLIGASNTPDGWYEALEKPAFNPPNWVFAPVWGLLYLVIGIVGARTWLARPRGAAMRLWFTQLAFNFAWSPVFFGLRDVAAAMIIVLGLLVSVGAFVFVTWRADRTAAVLFLPYLAWVAFATALNAAILVLN